MNDDLLIQALQREQQLGRPEFSASLHDRLVAAIDRERRRRRRVRLAAPLAAACLAIVAAMAVRDARTTIDQYPKLAIAEPEAPSLTATAGVEILLQRSDRAAAELRDRLDLPKWSLKRALDSSQLTRAVFDRLPIGGPLAPSPEENESYTL